MATLLFLVLNCVLFSRVASELGDCDFQTDFCSWTAQTHLHYQWKRIKSTTPSVNTGPSNDRNGDKSAYYVYAESSEPSVSFDRTTLTGPKLPATDSKCLRFWYNAFGKDIGELQVKLVSGARKDVLWVVNGNQGQKWREIRLDYNSKTEYNIVFEAERGEGFASDIAIDDVTFAEGNCPIPTTLPPLYPTTKSLPQKPEPLRVYGATTIGCYKDTNNRAFPEIVSLDRNTVDYLDSSKAAKRCRDILRSKGPEYSEFFALQYWYQCFFGKKNDARLRYDKHGKGAACDDYTGFAWHNMVYKLERDLL